MRQQFTMTEADLSNIMDACKPVPLMYLSGGRLMGPSQQENANAAWRDLGERMGFDYMTVRPAGEDNRTFTAEPIAVPEAEGVK